MTLGSRGDRGVYLSSKSYPHFSQTYYKKDVPVHCDINAMERGYELSRAAFEEDGRMIYNATLGSQLQVFEKASLESFAK